MAVFHKKAIQTHRFGEAAVKVLSRYRNVYYVETFCCVDNHDGTGVIRPSLYEYSDIGSASAAYNRICGYEDTLALADRYAEEHNN